MSDFDPDAFLREEEAKEKARAAFDPDVYLQAEATARPPKDQDIDDWRELGFVPDELPECHVFRWSDMGDPWDLDRFHTSRAWNAGALTFTARGSEIALSALSFVPLVMLVLLRRWIRWLRFGSVKG